jgi:hypothetical protein
VNGLWMMWDGGHRTLQTLIYYNLNLQ